jgi:aryl-alcohol dehydrogenase
VLGHEGEGVVERVGDAVRGVRAGDHVVLSFDACGDCRRCLRGYPSYCDHWNRLNFGGGREDGSTPLTQDGRPVRSRFFGQSSFATYALVPARAAVPVPDDVPLALMGPLGCGILTGAGAVRRAFGAEAGSSIAIFGAGAVGISAVMMAVLAGCTTIIAVDLVPERLELALELGATHTLDASTGGLAQQVKTISRHGVSYALDTTGVSSVMAEAADSLDSLGVLGHVAGKEITTSLGSLRWGCSLRGIVEGDSIPRVDIPELIELWKLGRFPFDQLVRRFPFSDIDHARRAALTGEAIKPLLVFD